MNFAIFVSGNGGFSKILYQNLHLIHPGNLALVISDRDCKACDFFRNETKIPTFQFFYDDYKDKKIFEQQIVDKLLEYKIEYIFLNYNRLVGDTILHHYENRIFNLHLSLLPLFKGFGAVDRAFQSDMLIYGATFHLVDNTIDGGPIIGQVCLARDIKDTQAGFTEKLFKATAVFFVDMVYKVVHYNIEKNDHRFFFKNAQYGSLPYNPNLSLEEKNIIF